MSGQAPFGARGHAANATRPDEDSSDRPERLKSLKQAAEFLEARLSDVRTKNNALEERVHELRAQRDNYATLLQSLNDKYGTEQAPGDYLQARDDESFTRGYNRGVGDKQNEHNQEMSSLANKMQATINDLVRQRDEALNDNKRARAEEQGRDAVRNQIAELGRKLVEYMTDKDKTLLDIMRHKRVRLTVNYQGEHSRVLMFAPDRLMRDEHSGLLQLVGTNETSGGVIYLDHAQIDAWDTLD